MKMKYTSVLVGTGALFLMASVYQAVAQDAAPEAAVTQVEAKSPVAAALSEMTFFNGSPSLDAKYYIYLESASWCGPCRAEMPRIAAAYKEMKENGVEIILVGQDSTPALAEKFLKSFDAAFPGVHGMDAAVAKLPGYKSAQYVPHAQIVDDKGNVLADGHGSLSLKWKKIISDYEAQKK